ncbi:hypothetical protein [Methanoculleus sp.]|uniref:hypothetical protein n=1 Tax=Methanoculleus sp. TaxID=90427 RepID=UPI002FC82AF8
MSGFSGTPVYRLGVILTIEDERLLILVLEAGRRSGTIPVPVFCCLWNGAVRGRASGIRFIEPVAMYHPEAAPLLL